MIRIAVALNALSATAHTARDNKGAPPLVVIQNEAPAKLIGLAALERAEQWQNSYWLPAPQAASGR